MALEKKSPEKKWSFRRVGRLVGVVPPPNKAPGAVSGARYVRDLFKDLLARSAIEAVEGVENETFEEAARRLELTKADLKRKEKAFLRSALIYFFGGILVCLYALYQFYTGSVIIGLITFLASTMFFVHAFICHFKFFQIKKRKLGCTFKEWFDGRVQGD